MIITDRKQLSEISLPLPANEQDDVFLALETEIRKHANAAGLSAPQIGILRQAFVYYSLVDERLGVAGGRTLVRIANPMVISTEGPSVESVEGCLSLPGVQYLVPRYAEICIQDDLHGRVVLTGDDALVAQHELDHLVGLTIADIGVLIPANIERNAPCYCGQHKNGRPVKYKHCHGR